LDIHTTVVTAVGIITGADITTVDTTAVDIITEVTMAGTTITDDKSPGA
jgi:hypothetical protein